MLDHGIATWLLLLLLLSGGVEQNSGPINNISDFLLKARGVNSINHERDKIVQFQSLNALKNSKIVCLTETWLSHIACKILSYFRVNNSIFIAVTDRLQGEVC